MKRTDWSRKNNPRSGRTVQGLHEMNDGYSDKINMGKAFFRTNMLDHAIKCFEEALCNEEMLPDALYYLGIIAFRKGDYERAVVSFKKLLEIRTNSINIFNNLAVSLEKCDLSKEALLVYNTGLEVTPTSTLLLGNRGVLKYKTGDYDGAISDLTRAIKHGTGSLFLYHYLGLALIKTQRFIEAKEILEAALSNTTGDATVFNNLGYLSLKLGLHEEAKGFLKEAIRSSSELKSPYINLAWLYAGESQLEVSLLMLRKAFPGDRIKVAEHLSRLADSLKGAGRGEEAAYLTRQAIEIKNGNQSTR